MTMQTLTMEQRAMLESRLAMMAAPVKIEAPISRDSSSGLVPTTIDISDPGYTSDGGFYPNEGSEKFNSGASTPLTVDDSMDSSWHDQYATNLLTSSGSAYQKYPSIYSPDADSASNAHFDQLVFSLENTTPTTVIADCNNNENSYLDSGHCSSDGEETDGAKAELPEILTRPVKGMTMEDKKLRRRELNRLAAQRSRQKKKSTSSTLAEESQRLARRNGELRKQLGALEKAKTELYDMIKNHFKSCSPKTTTPASTPKPNTPTVVAPKAIYPPNYQHHHHHTAVVPQTAADGNVYGVYHRQGYVSGAQQVR